MNDLLTAIPQVPSFGRLRLFLLISSALGTAAFVLPVRMSLVFTGSISANGPTTSLQSTTEGTIASLPPENKLLERNTILFQFQQPVLAADLEVLKVQESGLKSRLAQSRNECRTLLQNYSESLANARETFDLYAQAYAQQAISKVAFLSHRDAVDTARRLLQDQRAQCLRDSSALSSELEITREQIVKQQSATRFQQELRAPDRGSVHSVVVKLGQRVVKGEVLGQFTAVGSTGAQLRIPVQDRPFVAIGDRYTVYSKAYAFLGSPPQRQCKIASITPDVVLPAEAATAPTQAPSFLALCQFEGSPQEGPYPLLVGMPVDAYGTSVQASLVQLLLRGYRNLVTPTAAAQDSTSSS